MGGRIGPITRVERGVRKRDVRLFCSEPDDDLAEVRSILGILLVMRNFDLEPCKIPHQWFERTST